MVAVRKDREPGQEEICVNRRNVGTNLFVPWRLGVRPGLHRCSVRSLRLNPFVSFVCFVVKNA